VWVRGVVPKASYGQCRTGDVVQGVSFGCVSPWGGWRRAARRRQGAAARRAVRGPGPGPPSPGCASAARAATTLVTIISPHLRCRARHTRRAGCQNNCSPFGKTHSRSERTTAAGPTGPLPYRPFSPLALPPAPPARATGLTGPTPPLADGHARPVDGGRPSPGSARGAGDAPDEDPHPRKVTASRSRTARGQHQQRQPGLVCLHDPPVGSSPSRCPKCTSPPPAGCSAWPQAGCQERRGPLIEAYKAWSDPAADLASTLTAQATSRQLRRGRPGRRAAGRIAAPGA
jgi:hypothetical protein